MQDLTALPQHIVYTVYYTLSVFGLFLNVYFSRKHVVLPFNGSFKCSNGDKSERSGEEVVFIPTLIYYIVCSFFIYLASQDALEVMRVSE